MTAYIVLFMVITTLSALVAEYREKKRKSESFLMFSLILTILVVVAGIRGVGADFGNYMRLYENQKNLSLSDLSKALITFKEPGYKLLCVISKYIYDAPVTMFFLCSILTVVPILIMTYRATENIGFALVLYLLLVWVESFGAVRQALASSFIVTSFPYIKQKKFWKYALMIIVGAMFHITALVMLPIYFVITRKVSKRNVFLIILVSIFLRYSYGFIFEILNVYKGKDISEYSYMTSDVNIFRVLVAFAPIGLFYFIPKKQRRCLIELKQVTKLDISMNIVLVNAALMFATMGSAYLARIGSYLVAFFPIVIPEIIKSYDKKSYTVIVIMMCLLYCIYWLYGIQVQGLGYMTIFQR